MDNTVLFQDLFAKSIAGIVAQGGPSFDVNGSCLYRQVRPDGKVRKCGVGQWIPDEKYNRDWEGVGIGRAATTLKHEEILGACGLDYKNKDHVEFAREMQIAHDSIAAGSAGWSWDEWRGALKAVASKWGLLNHREVLAGIPKDQGAAS